MTFFLCQASGLLGASFPWSFRSMMSSTSSESAVEASWNGGIVAMFNTVAFQDLVAADVTVTQTYSSTMSADFRQTTKTVTDLSIAGSATQSMPYRTTEIVTWRTALATRYGHGRWFLPPMAVGALATDGFFLSAAAQTALVSAVNAALSSWSGTLNMVILHRNGAKGGVTPLTTDPVIAGDVPDSLATQRRRADKRVPARASLTF